MRVRSSNAMVVCFVRPCVGRVPSTTRGNLAEVVVHSRDGSSSMTSKKRASAAVVCTLMVTSVHIRLYANNNLMYKVGVLTKRKQCRVSRYYILIDKRQ